MRKFILAVATLAILTLTVFPATPDELLSSTRTAPGFLPIVVTIRMGPAINSETFPGGFVNWLDGFDNYTGEPRRRFAPGSLLQARIDVFDLASGTPVAVNGGQLTSDYTDYSANFALQLNDGFHIQATNCGAQNLYIKQVTPNRVPSGALDIGSQTVIFYWPGSASPEYGSPCSASSYGTEIFYFYKGSGAFPAGMNSNYTKTVFSAPAFPTTYITNIATPQGRYIPIGYHVRWDTGVYTPLTTCKTNPNACPITTSGVSNTLVLYTQGLGQAIGSGFASHSTLKLTRIPDGAVATPNRTYFGASNYLAEQHNFSLSSLGPGTYFLNWSCSQLLGCTPQSYAFWTSNVAQIHIGPPN